jgi:predicted permease
MAGQIAIACILLVGASLLTRGFVALLHADRGYDPHNVLSARIPMPPGYSLDHRVHVLESLVERLKSVEGVSNVAFGNALPLVSSGGFRAFRIRPPADPSVEIEVNTIERVVSPGYFAALGLRLKAGRTFSDADTMSSPKVIVVNRSFATKYLSGRPLGASIPNLGMCRGDDDRWEVVGVVDDLRQGDVLGATQPEVFLPHRQIGCPTALDQPILVLRTKSDPASYASWLKTALREEAPTLALDSVMTMEERVMTDLAKPRLYAVVLAGFGGFALAIAAAGLFGVLSYGVAQRSREIGVRTALGAARGDIVALVARQALAITGGGLAVGLATAFVLSQSVAKLLYGVKDHDVVTFVAVPAALALAATVACIVPARRAANIDPLQALRRG